MCFTDSELKAAVAKAKELSAEIMKNVPIVELAKSLATQKSNGAKIPASDEAKDWYATIQNYAEVIDICQSLLADYGSYLKTAIEKGVNVKGKAKIQKRAAAKKFNEKIFIAKYPELYKQYSTVTYPVRGSFRLAPAKDWDVDISTISDEQVSLLEEFKTKLEGADHSIETGFALHSLHLGVLEIQKYAEWESDLANQNLRALTGQNEGIEGICTWKREEKEVRVFDKDALQAEFPDAYNDCVIEGNETEALIVEPKIADI